MIPHQSIRMLDSNLESPARKFQINASAQAFQILSSNIYSNKILAVIREIIANAVDAHCKAGTQDRPFEVHLPTTLEPWFEVRDFGPGLSDSAIHELYTTYFGSDKQLTNELIGGKGLGSKAPLAYTDQFTVVSYHGGVYSEYLIFIDESGTPNVTRTNTHPSGRDKGLAVRVAVKSTDFHEFESEARKVLTYIGAPYTVNKEVLIDLKPPPALFQIPTPFGMADIMPEASANACYVVEGGIRYNLQDIRKLPDSGPFLITHKLVVRLNTAIGTCDIAASRESLSMNKQTVEKLDRALMHVENFFRSQVPLNVLSTPFQAYINQLPSWEEAAPLLDWAYKTQVFGFEALSYRGRKRTTDIAPNISLCKVLINHRRTKKGGARKWIGSSELIDHLKHYGLLQYLRDFPVLWSPTMNRPFINTIENNKYKLPDQVYIAYGNRDKVEAWIKDLGFEPHLLEIPAPVSKSVAKQTASSGGSSLYYTGKDATEYSFHELRAMAVHGEVVLIADTKSNVDQWKRYLTYYCDLGLYNKPTTVVYITPTYKTVRQRLQKKGAFIGFDAWAKAHVPDPIKCHLVNSRDAFSKIVKQIWIETNAQYIFFTHKRNQYGRVWCHDSDIDNLAEAFEAAGDEPAWWLFTFLYDTLFYSTVTELPKAWNDAITEDYKDKAERIMDRSLMVFIETLAWFNQRYAGVLNETDIFNGLEYSRKGEMHKSPLARYLTLLQHYL